MKTYLVEIGATVNGTDVDATVLQLAHDPLHASTLAIQTAIGRWPEGKLHYAHTKESNAEEGGVVPAIILDPHAESTDELEALLLDMRH